MIYPDYKKLLEYIDILHTLMNSCNLGIGAIGVASNSTWYFTNGRHYHAEELVLLQCNPIMIIVSHEPCPRCMFMIVNSSVEYLIYLYPNHRYGGCRGKYNIHELRKNLKCWCIFPRVFKKLKFS